MAINFNQKPDDKQVNPAQNPEQKQRGSGFVNVQSYQQANDPTRLGQSIAGKLGQEGQRTQAQLQQERDKFTKASAGASSDINQANKVVGQIGNVNYGTIHSQQQPAFTGPYDKQIVNPPLPTQYDSVTKTWYNSDPITGERKNVSTTAPNFYNPFKNIATNENIALGGRLRAGYTGPIGLGNQEQLLTQANVLGQEAKSAATDAGRQALLRKYIGNPQYTSGQQQLDALLLGAQGNKPINAAAIANKNIIKDVNQSIVDTGLQAGKLKTDFGTAADSWKNILNTGADKFSGVLDKAALDRSKLSEQAYKDLAAKLGKFTGLKLRNGWVPELKAGEGLDEATVNQLSQLLGPSVMSQGIYGLTGKDILNWIGSGGAAGDKFNTDYNKSNISHGVDKATIDALKALSGNNDLVTGYDASKMGTAKQALAGNTQVAQNDFNKQIANFNNSAGNQQINSAESLIKGIKPFIDKYVNTLSKDPKTGQVIAPGVKDVQDFRIGSGFRTTPTGTHKELDLTPAQRAAYREMIDNLHLESPYNDAWRYVQNSLLPASISPRNTVLPLPIGYNYNNSGGSGVLGGNPITPIIDQVGGLVGIPGSSSPGRAPGNDTFVSDAINRIAGNNPSLTNALSTKRNDLGIQSGKFMTLRDLIKQNKK